MINYPVKIYVKTKDDQTMVYDFLPDEDVPDWVAARDAVINLIKMQTGDVPQRVLVSLK